MPSILTLEELSALGRWRWIVPVLALLAEREGARFVELLNALSLPRDSLTRTIEGGVAAGWIMRNPGHGHPLRPEYVLTAEGWRMAETAKGVVAAQFALGLPASALTRWSLPLVRLIADGNRRFNALARGLGEASPRALTLSLKALVGHELVGRTLIDGYPPAADYGLTRGGDRIARALS